MSPQGDVAVMDLESGKQVLTAKVRRDHLKGVIGAHLMNDGRAFYVGLRAPNDKDVLSVFPNTIPGSGLRSVPVNGEVYCFNGDGAVRWIAEAAHQRLIVAHAKELPFIVLTARVHVRDALGMGVITPRTSLIDKRTGKLLFNREKRGGPVDPFHSLRIDAAKSVIELTSYNYRLRLEPKQ